MSALLIILSMTFNFHSIEIQGDTLRTTSSNKTYRVCEFSLESEELIKDIQESVGECFDDSIISIYGEDLNDDGKSDDGSYEAA